MPSSRNGSAPASQPQLKAAPQPQFTALPQPQSRAAAESPADAAHAVRRRAAPRPRPAARPAWTRQRPAGKRGASQAAPTAPTDGRQREHRSAGAGGAAAGEGAAQPELSEETGRRRSRHRLVVPAVLGAVALVLAAAAAWFAVPSSSLAGTAAASNMALTDRATTSQLIAVATTDVNALFSYTSTDPGRTQAAANADLTGAAVGQYARLYRAVRQDAASKHQFVLTTAVTSAGVETLSGSSARVLVFSSQVLSSVGEQPQSYDAMVAVNLSRTGSTWKLAGIDTFSGGA